MVESIRQAIVAAVPDAIVHVSTPDNTHFEAVVVSATFDGMPLVRQHQQVMQALKTHFDESVHALQLKTFTPAGWEAAKDQYNV